MDAPDTLSRLEKLEDTLLAQIQEVRCITVGDPKARG